MEQTTILKQMINFNKTMCNNAFNTMTMLQDQMEKMANMSTGPGVWMPEGGRNCADEYAKAYRQGCRNFKNAVDENFKRAEDFFAGAVKEKEDVTKNAKEKEAETKNAKEKENVTKK